MVLKVINADSASFAMVSALNFGDFDIVSHLALLADLAIFHIRIWNGNTGVDQGAREPADIEVNHDNQVHVKIKSALHRGIELEQQVNRKYIHDEKTHDKKGDYV